MTLQDRLRASLDLTRQTLEDVHGQIDEKEGELANLREYRLRKEEEALEMQLLLNLVRDTGLKVERREEDGVLVASVDEKYGTKEAVQ